MRVIIRKCKVSGDTQQGYTVHRLSYFGTFDNAGFERYNNESVTQFLNAVYFISAQDCKTMEFDFSSDTKIYVRRARDSKPMCEIEIVEG